MAEKHAGGRPPLYKSAEEMQKVIDKYFKDCDGEMLLNKQGEPVFDKYGQPVFIHVKPLTVTGLALALGFTSRQAILNYQDKQEFVDTVTRAKARVEQYTESRLFDRDGAMGAKFSLANNFKEWRDKQDIEHSGAVGVSIVDDIK
jgi:hypothetical protein